MNDGRTAALRAVSGGVDGAIAVVALLHDICKAEFISRTSKIRRSTLSMASSSISAVPTHGSQVPYYTVDEKFPFGHGEKSVFLINEHMRLTREEALAIVFTW